MPLARCFLHCLDKGPISSLRLTDKKCAHAVPPLRIGICQFLPMWKVCFSCEYTRLSRILTVALLWFSKRNILWLCSFLCLAICILGNEQTLFCSQRTEFSNGTEINTTLYIFVLIMSRAPILCYFGVPVLSAPLSVLPAQNSADLNIPSCVTPTWEHTEFILNHHTWNIHLENA